MQKKRNALKCEQCGKCCHYEIPITLYDIHQLAGHLAITDREAFESYIQKEISTTSKLFMIEKRKDESCVFLDSRNRCSVHAAKPMGCVLFNCSDTDYQKVRPRFSSCLDEDTRTRVWRQSIAMAITRAYIERYGPTWNEESYLFAISSVKEHSGCEGNCKVKLSLDHIGNPMAMVYCCDDCTKKGEMSRETIVTLDDIQRISDFLEIRLEALFNEYIDECPSPDSGALRLKRGKRCIFFNDEGNCRIEEVRPMHCRFTPCPKKTRSSEIMDHFYLGAGTLEDQFRHHVSLAYTREYVSRHGTNYYPDAYKAIVQVINQSVNNEKSFLDFCQKIGPYRYLDDVKSIMIDNERS